MARRCNPNDPAGRPCPTATPAAAARCSDSASWCSRTRRGSGRDDRSCRRDRASSITFTVPIRSFTCGLSAGGPETLAATVRSRRRKKAMPFAPTRQSCTPAPFCVHSFVAFSVARNTLALSPPARPRSDEMTMKPTFFASRVRHERMAIVRIRVMQVADHVADLLRIGPRPVSCGPGRDASCWSRPSAWPW